MTRYGIYTARNIHIGTRDSLSPDMNFPDSIYSISRQLHTVYYNNIRSPRDVNMPIKWLETCRRQDITLYWMSSSIIFFLSKRIAALNNALWQDYRTIWIDRSNSIVSRLEYMYKQIETRKNVNSTCNCLSHNPRSGSAITPCRKSHIALVQYRFLLPRIPVIRWY